MRVKSSSPAVFISVSGLMISNTSPPEQKLPPAPAITIALTPLSRAVARKMLASSA
jgi:hypothetical protein